MIVLAVIAVLILAASVWFLARPVTSPPALSAAEEHHELLQQRGRLLTQLSDLDIETADRNMDAAVIGDERQRLEAELAQVLRHLESLAPAAAVTADALPARARRMTHHRAGSVVAGRGHRALCPVSGQNRSSNSRSSVRADNPTRSKWWRAWKKRDWKARPTIPTGWARLGRSYAVLERFDDAKRAYTKATQLTPDDAEILTDYATLLISENPRQPSQEALTAFTRLYQLNPKHPGALWVWGSMPQQRQVQAGDKAWEALLKELPPDAEVGPQVRHVVEQARGEKRRAKTRILSLRLQLLQIQRGKNAAWNGVVHGISPGKSLKRQ